MTFEPVSASNQSKHTDNPLECCGATRDGYVCTIHKDKHQGLRHCAATRANGQWVRIKTWSVNPVDDFFESLGL